MISAGVVSFPDGDGVVSQVDVAAVGLTEIRKEKGGRRAGAAGKSDLRWWLCDRTSHVRRQAYSLVAVVLAHVLSCTDQNESLRKDDKADRSRR